MYSARNQLKGVHFCYTKTEQCGRSASQGERNTLEFSGDVEGVKDR